MPPRQPSPERDLGPVPAHVVWVTGVTGLRAPGGATDGIEIAAEERALLGLVEGALGLGIRWLTIQVPSAPSILRRQAADLARRGVQIVELTGVSARVGDGVAGGDDIGAAAVTATAAAPGLTVFAASGPSGRAEIVEAVRRMAADGVTSGDVDERAVAARLYIPDVPDPDLVVSCGGDRRVPDLLLWEVAYSELAFLDETWPAVDRTHVEKAVAEYQRRDRRYGGLVTVKGGS